jgi:hypothetical protein
MRAATGAAFAMTLSSRLQEPIAESPTPTLPMITTDHTTLCIPPPKNSKLTMQPFIPLKHDRAYSLVNRSGATFVKRYKKKTIPKDKPMKQEMAVKVMTHPHSEWLNGY